MKEEGIDGHPPLPPVSQKHQGPSKTNMALLFLPPSISFAQCFIAFLGVS
jgi:hypothetical protein